MVRADDILAVIDGHAEGCVVEGEWLDLAPEIPRGACRLAAFDPPYQLNAKSAADGKLNPWADLCNAAFWFAEVQRQCWHALSDDGALWQCLNWRTMPTIQKAVFDTGRKIESLLVWDKEWIGPGGSKGLRPSYELVALVAGPQFSIPCRGLPDILRVQWSSHKPSGHPAEKPVGLFDFIIRHSTSAGDVVLDPFCGSGTTCVAAKKLGRRYIGIDIDPDHVRKARARLRDTPRPLFACGGGQQ